MKIFGVVREENKKSTRKKMPKIRLFCPQYVTVMFPNFGWPDYLFTKTARRNQLVVPKINQEINEPSYEMVGVNITVTYCGQNKLSIAMNFILT
jgi:hypothetical protein